MRIRALQMEFWNFVTVTKINNKFYFQKLHNDWAFSRNSEILRKEMLKISLSYRAGGKNLVSQNKNELKTKSKLELRWEEL